MSVEETTAIGQRFVAIFNEQNPAIADEIFAPSFKAYVSGAPELDREGWKAYLQLFRASFPDLHLVVEDLVATDDKVVIRGSLRGTHQEAFQGIPATGKQVAFAGIAMHRIAHGQSVEHWGVMDLLSLLQQLGALPAPGPA